jgi:sulfur-oxidizing protein SoxZ
VAARTILSVPPRVKRGQVFEVKALVGHVMETGFRHTESGALVPRDIIRAFSCSYNGVEVFRADFHPAVAANPLVEFPIVAVESGRLQFRWTGDNDFVADAAAEITVE